MEYIWGKTIKWIRFFPGYAVTVDGKVASYIICEHHKNPIWLGISLARGQPYVEMYRGGKGLKRKIHRLVYFHFIGSLKKGFVVHHKDENPQNNSIDNLVQCSKSDHNSIHSRKLSFEDARFIRFLYLRNYGKDITQQLLSKIFDVSLSVISNIIKGKTYANPNPT